MDEQTTQTTGGGSGSAKWIIGLIILALVIWGIVAASKNKKQGEEGKPTTKSEQAGPFKVGVLLPLTGEAAIYGEPMKNVVALAAEEINKSGGVNGQTLEMIYEDGKCNGKDGASAMQKLVNVNNVQIVLGGFCSSESLAAVPIATQNKVALFSPGSSSPDLTGISPYFFRNYPSDAFQGKVLAEIANKKGWKNVAFIVENKDYPLGIYKAFTQRFEELSGKTTKEEFPPETTDFRSIIAKIKNQKADAVFVSTQAPQASERVLKQMSEQGLKANLMLADVVPGDAKTVENNKIILEGALIAEFGTDPSNPKFKQMVTNYKTKFGTEPSYLGYSQTIYDAVFMIRDAIATVGYSGEKIAQWSRTVKNWEGASGKITIGPNGDPLSGHRAEIIKNGKVEPYTE